MTKIWRYVVRYDDGLAPCIESDFCTLTCCKPRIRKHASKDDWVIGFHSNQFGDAMLCYVMRVTEAPMPYAQYWNDTRFFRRRDNLYRPVNGKLVWVPNRFRDHDDEDNHATDHSGVSALISEEYWYFNKDEAFSLCDHLDEGVVKRLWRRFVGEQYNGLIDGDFETLLRFLDQNHPQGSSRDRPATARRRC